MPATPIQAIDNDPYQQAHATRRMRNELLTMLGYLR